jgi:hypothetical protein
MIRSVLCFGVVLLVACQTGSGLPPATADELRGCWIEIRESEATTFRWFQDQNNPNVFAGDQMIYGHSVLDGSNHTAWRIDQPFGLLQLCTADSHVQENVCWPLLLPGTKLRKDQRWASIDADMDTLVISFRDDQVEWVLFNGVRDGCD